MPEPITGELRDAMKRWGWVAEDGMVTFGNCTPPSIDADPVLSIYGSDFDRMCDAIDAIHANLERENESLRRELDRTRGEWDYWESTHVELPKDSDGVPIHVGDVMEGEKIGGGYCEPFEVIGYVVSNGELEPMDEHKCPRKHKYSRHHHASDTWERIIEDAIRGDGGSYGCLEERFNATVPPLVARCKALAGDAE